MEVATAKHTACKSDFCSMLFTNEDNLTVREKKNDIMLNLSLSGQKSSNLFAADQTPTPTCLIKNCEEIGLFDDLRHVNPFDETFRRAVEQSGSQTSRSYADGSVEAGRNPIDDSLHTPHLFPQFEVVEMPPFPSCKSIQKVLKTPDVPSVEQIILADEMSQNAATKKLPENRQNSKSNSCSPSTVYGKLQKYKNIMEKPAEYVGGGDGTVQLPVSVQLNQPQVITLSFPSSASNTCRNNMENLGTISPAIPVQTVKPFILPAPATTISSSRDENENALNSGAIQPATTAGPDPSSASLTPTSQLPIKERLKIILSSNSKGRTVQLPEKTSRNKRHSTTAAVNEKALLNGNADIIERRRAASTRYRHKMRSAHEDLRRRNTELQAENEKLKQRIKQLELELSATQRVAEKAGTQPVNTDCAATQVQIPSSTLHLILNIPSVIIPSNGQPIMNKSVTHTVENK